MNAKEYIESGLLEAYMLGALSEKEAQEVSAAIAMYPELAEEMKAIEATMLQFASRFAKQPPQGLQQQIWGAIEGASANAGNGEQTQKKTPKTIPSQPEYRKPMQWKYAALWVGLAGSLVLNAALWMRNENMKADMLSINTKMASLEQDQKQTNGMLAGYRKNKEMMVDTAMQTIVMHTVQPGHPMAATVYWSKNKGEAYVSADGLPTPPKGMQYQLWVMQNGKPVDMGVLPLNIAGTPEMQHVGKAVTDGQAFAISLEKEGGSPSPTMQNIYVMGKV